MKIQVMIVSLVLALAGYVTAAGALESSAVLRQMQGRVFIGQATTMELARDDLPLYAGNRVVAVAGGRAEVVYSDGCAVAVPENSLLVVEGPRQCRQGRGRVRTIDGFQDTRIGQAGPLPTAAGSTSPANASPANSTPASSPPTEAGANDWAARLEQPKGSTFVEEDGIRVPARRNMGVQSDTRLITGKDGAVTVVFEDCKVEIGPSEDVKVEELKTRCKGGILAGTGAAGTGAGGATVGAGAGIAAAGAINGGIVVAGLGTAMVAAAILDDNKLDAGSASPQ